LTGIQRIDAIRRSIARRAIVADGADALDGAGVFGRALAQWRRLPAALRSRYHGPASPTLPFELCELS